MGSDGWIGSDRINLVAYTPLSRVPTPGVKILKKPNKILDTAVFFNFCDKDIRYVYGRPIVFFMCLNRNNAGFFYC